MVKSSTDQQLELELNEVSYAVIDVEQSENSINNKNMNELASAINVRLSLEGNQEFPFVPFDNFDNLLFEEKIFLYGTSGSGKSRALFELINRVVDKNQRIYIINPRNNVGHESGRMPLRELVNKINPDDVLIWDNFPDDIVRRDIQNIKSVLETLSSKSFKKLIVVLKPKYLEVFRSVPKQYPEFYPHEISYSKDQFQKIMQEYGAKIYEFQTLYKQYISDHLEKISRILWNIEPIPLKVFDFYNALKIKNNDANRSENLDAIEEAKTFLRSTNYYQHQFGLLSRMSERKGDVDFLCILKMCYDLGIDRTESNISRLQNSIFGTESPKEAFNKLSNWLYISGQDYAMHDVCREAIKLSDYMKMKILSYISENLDDVIKIDSEQSLNLLGLFIGRNIEFASLKNSSNNFLPDSIYSQMKKNAELEKSIGLGVGEVFRSLDDELRNIFRNKCDTDIIFGMGMAEGLAQSFILLDSEQRKLVLDKIYSGFLFARFFGKTLGLLLKDLDLDIRNEILSHVDSNSQFADGIGMGIGPELDYVDEELREHLIELSKQNIALTRGLGFSLTSNIVSLDKTQRSLIYSKTDDNFQSDVGLSFGLAEKYVELPKEIQEEALRRCKDHNGFAKGFGLYLILFTLQKCPPEVLSLVDENGELAYSLGFGCGWVFPYLSSDFQQWSVAKSHENNRFERGLGFGMGLILRHLPTEENKKQLSMAKSRGEFDFGLGSGISFTWDCQTNEDRQAANARCVSNNSFAQGLGYGHGYSFHYLTEEEKSETFSTSKNNSQFAQGLGYGLGWSFPYSDDHLKNKMFEISNSNNYFGYGFGSGLGQLFRYFSNDVRNNLFQRATENGWFDRGLGMGLGMGLGRYAFSYLDDSLQNEIFLKAKNNPEFSLGLGEGFGREFTFFSDDLKRKILENYLPQNSFTSSGLGKGFGLSFQYLSETFQLELFERAEKNISFAIGLGEGIGMIYPYLTEKEKNEIMFKIESIKNKGLSRGLGSGLGCIFQFLANDFKNELLYTLAAKNLQFSIGLGKGIGSIFMYLSDDIRDSMIKFSAEHADFAIGLGEGIGTIFFNSMNYEFRNILISRTKDNISFQKGLGKGIGSFYRYYEKNPELKHEIFESLLTNPTVSSGFGIGIGEIFPFLSESNQNNLINLSEQNDDFARNIGFCLGHVMPSTKFSNNEHFVIGLGSGSGHHFPYFDEETQGEILKKALTNKEFGSGFGLGLAKSFNQLDEILEKEILTQCSVDNEFSYSLGYGLGNTFTSHSGNLQKKFLQIIENQNFFSKGFLDGVRPNLKYIDKESLTQIFKILEKTESSDVTLSTTLKNSQDLSSINNNFDYDYFLEVELASKIDGQNPHSHMHDLDEVSFIGDRKKCCVCFIDMVSSTKITSQLNEVQLSKYYSVFLNSMATIINNFNGKIIKNVGDALLYYFPDTSGIHPSPSKIRDVLECGITMTAAHDAINSKMQEENLPPINYRISADFGIVEVAKSHSSKTDDLFGFAISICSKINHEAQTNGMVIGDELYKIAKSLKEEYSISSPQKIELDLVDTNEYVVYHINQNPNKKIIQPFTHKSIETKN